MSNGNGQVRREFVLVDRLDQLLAPPREVRSDLSELLRAIFDRKYTGRITLHCKDGIPMMAEFPAPHVKLG